MATVFETRLIGNIGKDAVVRKMDKGVLALNFPVAHNKNWRDKRTGEQKTKTTWVNCTIWKKDGTNLRILDFLKKGCLVEVVGTPFAKGYLQDDQTVKSEIRLNVSKTNILKASSESTNLYKNYEDYYEDEEEDENDESDNESVALAHESY
ncbi:single-stranded DNA-binding protein [Crocinitomix algicola]|uniref:single-stranded DNA-binding protein n=1 Tax=Crocinitomix algicola TaxID=1740263 RepID=UPI000834A9EE|nr:single-stranded DNA-binding protein [Crocinitomix algicola]